MRVALWVVQVLLAVLFAFHGYSFIVVPEGSAAMIENLGLDPTLQMTIGIAEWLAAAGLLLPGITRILPVLTPLAAAGLCLVMICAAVFHLMRGEAGMAIGNIVIMALAAAVAYGRWKIAPLRSRGAS